METDASSGLIQIKNGQYLIMDNNGGKVEISGLISFEPEGIVEIEHTEGDTYSKRLHDKKLTGVAFVDGELVTCAEDGRVKCWRADKLRDPAWVQTGEFMGHGPPLTVLQAGRG